MNKVREQLQILYKALMTGVSYMIPFVVAGGVLMAISFLGGNPTETGFQINNEFMKNLNSISKAGFTMMIPALAAYVSYSIGGRPALAPGFIIGFIANNPIGDTKISAGFVGALLMGIIVGYIVRFILKLKVPMIIRSIMPILVIPVITTFFAGIIYIYIVSGPIISFSNLIMKLLTDLSGSNLILFAIVLGLICEIDMGGPITKTVTLFTIALMANGNFVANGIYRVCPSIPPLAILISNYLFKNKWTKEDMTAAHSAGVMGLVGITEGAIPFVVKDAKSILPRTMIGCSVGAVIAALGQVESPVPHGGFITAPVVKNPLVYIIAMIVGSFVGALIIGFLKKPIINSEY
ncbi:MAG: PTS fructose transporter subunit IIC [Tissierellia bacterium]|nr:PTS fructose transporter subunit IIC [Tissierellia bacterium]